MSANSSPIKNQRFAIHFSEGHEAAALVVDRGADPNFIIKTLGFDTTHPAIFITGGASAMSDEDKQMTGRMIEEGVARFAQENQITVIDGGTESGVMHMLGDARQRNNYTFPLIGVAPLGRVQFPGFDNTDQEAELEDGHSHFVLVDAQEWGDESEMIVSLASTLSRNGQNGATGILINGGRISKQDVFLATTKDAHKLPILVLEGSGRFADELATAFRTGKTNQRIIRAILAGGDIELLSTPEGPEAMYEKLKAKLKKGE